MEAVIGGIIEILKSAGPSLCVYVDYHRKLQENMEILRRKLGELNSRKDDIELRLSIECKLGKSTKAEVNNWLENTQMINDEAQTIEHKLKKVKYFSRSRLGKLVLEKIEEVEKHYAKGQFESLVIDAPARGVVFPTTTLVGETTAKKNMDEIWQYLINDEIMKIGVCGMGGVGKTNIMTHINNKLLSEKNKFEKVIWITVSQPLDLMKLQDQIAISLKEDLSRDEDKKIRAGKVLEMLKRRRFVLILDDMWEAFQLQEVGIPEPTKDNGCKLVITTRSLDVCRSLDCRVVVHVKPLPEDEALKLFVDQVGDSIIQSPTLEEIVKLVVKQCAGLPLAIVTVAGCMKGEYDINEWRNALEELSQHINSIKGTETKIPAQLKFSYDRLKDEKVQHCFLYCSLYPEDFAISKDELIQYWIAEGLVDERGSMQATYVRGQSILNRLVNNCLLENAKSGRCVKMHDLVRDMALDITSKSPLFMIKAGERLREFPGEIEWKENLEKVSLMRNKITEIPPNTSPNCQALLTLLLQSNPLKSISRSFFVNMHGLKILDLSHTPIKELPDSVSDLRNLTALLLGNCFFLVSVPSLAKLVYLRYLDLGRSKIKEVPGGMEMLEYLRYLNIYSERLDNLPAGILSKLQRLQRLHVYWGLEPSEETIEEASRLSQLDTFEGLFCRLKDFNLYIKSLESRGHSPRKYSLLVGAPSFGQTKTFFGLMSKTIFANRFVFSYHSTLSEGFVGGSVFPDPIEDVDQYRKNERLTEYSSHIERPNVDRYVRVEGLRKPDGELIVVPKDVESVIVRECTNVGSLSDLTSNSMYKDLKGLYIQGCKNLKKLFSPKLLRALQNLEVIEVEECVGVEEIITLNDDEGEGTSIPLIFTLPKLRRLYLAHLPKLKSICSSRGICLCDSLRKIVVKWCPELKRLPLFLHQLENGQLSPHPAIKEIDVEKDWWEALEWDNPNAKSLLQPCCRFMIS